MSYFTELPPELILSLSSALPLSSLNALLATCRRLQAILQPDLDARITPELGIKLLSWAATGKPHIVAKLLAPPHSVDPTWGSPLHAAVGAKNIETTRMLLEAGADPTVEWDQEEIQPLHLAAQIGDVAVATLLLDHGAPINSLSGCDGAAQNPLHSACIQGNLEMVKLLTNRGADINIRGHYGPALGFAVTRTNANLDVVKLLLDKGTDATVTVPLFILLEGAPPEPLASDLLYIALHLRHPRRSQRPGRHWKPAEVQPPWDGLPLGEHQKRLMAMLLAHGARKETTMTIIETHLAALAKEAQRSEQKFLQIIEGMFTEAENAIPDVLSTS